MKLKRDIAKGAAWMILARWTLRFIGIISTVILARLLIPEDFGLVAMAMTVVALIELMSWLGLEAILIRHVSPTKAHYDTAWSLNLCALTFCASVTALAAYPAAQFFNEPRLTLVMLILAATWALQSLENIGTVDFRRNMQFDREFLFMTGKKLSGFVVCVVCAFVWRSYWALVAGIVASRLSGIALSYLMHPLRPRWSLVHWREMMSFSRATLANGALQFAGTRIPHIFVGRMEGPGALGVYALAEEVATLPTTELVEPIGRTLFPAYSKLAADRATLRDYVLFVNAAVVAVALPACIGIALVATPIVLLALGPKWVEAIPIMQVLAISACCMAVRSNSWSLYYAIERPFYTTRLWTVKLVALLAVIWPLYQHFGLIGIAYADLLSMIIMLAADVGTLLVALSIPFATYLRAMARPIIATAAMAVVVSVGSQLVLGTPHLPGTAIEHATRLAFGAALGAATYAVIMLLLWQLAGRPDGPEGQVLERARALLESSMGAGRRLKK